ncbi:hypothetical protein K443DRAFT_337335 [Laccaria amethystina LaAM-08-1]|uniref:Uncharacterized protein n=1 Tax=Laccaria amethystina LaAM-08-1 TaxID=1095629 RepID=A0A0C9WTC5_9AGAR|nr:hypothetical protein K443DRAFT_337335 [Laccaria amethystina LaAM-08-1]
MTTITPYQMIDDRQLLKWPQFRDDSFWITLGTIRQADIRRVYFSRLLNVDFFKFHMFTSRQRFIYIPPRYAYHWPTPFHPTSGAILPRIMIQL